MTTERRIPAHQRRSPARRSSIALGVVSASSMLALTGLIGVADATSGDTAPMAVSAPPAAASKGTLTVIVVPREQSVGAGAATRQPPPAPVATQPPALQADTNAS